jgi:hypothetical protein
VRQWPTAPSREPLAPPGATMGAGHVGLGPGLVDEDEARGIKPVLVLAPLHPSPGDGGTILLAGEQAFLNDGPSRSRNSKARHSLPSPRDPPDRPAIRSVRSGSAATRASSHSRSGSSTGTCPPNLPGATPPVRRWRCDQRTALATLTPNCAAAVRAERPMTLPLPLAPEDQSNRLGSSLLASAQPTG